MENTVLPSPENISPKPRPKCGIVMPISAIDGLPKEHWADMLFIFKEVADSAGFEPNLVSDADEVSVIQKTIIQNLYNNEIVVCDVSAKNPNVMFEMGMRLAFDKPTIIVKDNNTDFTFDTSIIEHIQYPRDLRLPLMLAFKEKLKIKLQKTYERAKNDPANYTTFLKNFGEFKIAQLQEKQVTSEEFILNIVQDMANDIKILKSQRRLDVHNSQSSIDESNFRKVSINLTDKLISEIAIKGIDLTHISGDELLNQIEKYISDMKISEQSKGRLADMMFLETKMRLHQLTS